MAVVVAVVVVATAVDVATTTALHDDGSDAATTPEGRGAFAL